MNLGEAYLWRDHLWVVITLPDANGSVVVVNFTSWYDGCDESCVFEVGEHAFVKHKTVIDYGLAQFFTAPQQKDFLRNAVRKPAMDLSDELLERIQIGSDSDYISAKVQKVVDGSYKAQQAAKKPPPAPTQPQ